MLSPHSISSIKLQILASHVAAGITDKVDVRTLEFLGVSVAAHGDHRQPQVLNILGHKVRETRVDIPRRDAVHPGKVTPFVGQRAGHVNCPSLGNVVRSLFLGEVDDVTRHAGGNDEAALSTLLEVRAHGLGTVEGASQVGVHHGNPVLDGAVKNAAVGGLPGVGNEGIDLAKLGNDVLHQLGYALPAGHVTLVCLGLDAVLLTDLLGVLLTTLRTRRVRQGNVGTEFCAPAGGLDTHTTGTRSTRDDNGSALQAEQVQQAFSSGDRNRHSGCWRGSKPEENRS